MGGYEARELMADRFVLHEALGEGGMGRVFRAFDRKMGCDVALKTLRRLGPEQVYHQKREFRLFAEVVHPNLVELFNLVVDGRAGFFTMELLHGTTLVEHVRWGGFGIGGAGLHVPPTDAEIARLRGALPQLSAGLATLHAAGRLHRDVKPANVMVTREGRVVLLDFGLAALLGPSGSGATEPRELAGTIGYMSPEQAWNEALSPASDWYSVGVILYEALTGRLPFEGPPARVLVAKKGAARPSPGDLVRGVPAELDRLVHALLDPDPAQRAGACEIAAWSAASTPAKIFSSHSGRRAFIGRAREFEALRSAAAGARVRGVAAVIHLRGPSGIGKSALLAEFGFRLEREAGALALGGRCHPRESVPWKGLDGVVDGLSQYLQSLPDADAAALRPPGAAALGRLFPVLLGLPGWGDIDPGDEEPAALELRRRGARALRDLLTRIAAARPVVVSIDDVQWGDADTASLLAELLREEPPPIALVLAYREGDAAPEGLPAQTHEITLGPMATGDIAALSRAILGGEDAPAGDLEAIAEESAGNPFFAGELTRWMALTGHRGAVRVDEVIRDRVAQLPSEERRLIEVVALAGRPLPRSLALQAAGVARAAQPMVLRLRLEQLLCGTVVGDEVALESAHDRLREAVVASLAPEARRARHRDLAAALEARSNPDPEHLLEHLLGADERGRAGACARAVADRAMAALAFNRAAHHYRLALDLDEGGAPTWPWREKLGAALASAGRPVEAAEAYREAAAALSRESPGHGSLLSLRRNAAEQYLRGGRVEEGLGALREVLAGTGLGYPETPLWAVTEIVGRRLALSMTGFRYRDPTPPGAHPRDLAQLDACWSAALGLNMIDILRSAFFQSRHASLALRAGDASHLFRAIGAEMCYAACAGGSANRARVERIRLRVARALARFGDAEQAAFVDLCDGVALYFAGRFREALAPLAAAEEVFRRLHEGTTWEVANCRMYRVWSLSWLGEFQDLARTLRPLVEAARSEHNVLALSGLTAAHANLHWLVMGRPDEGRARADESVRAFPARSFQSPHFVDLLAQVRIDLYQGDGAVAWRRLDAAWPKVRAIQLLRMQLFRVELCYLRTCAALAAALDGSAHRGSLLGVAEQATRRLEREDLPCARPLALLARAGVAAARGQAAMATEARIAASQAADDVEMAAMAAAARLQAGRTEGEAWLRAAGVTAPSRFAAALVPGPV